MILRKNISLTEDYITKLNPLIEKHNGNLSAVIREVIDLAGRLRDEETIHNKKTIRARYTSQYRGTE